MPKLRRAGFLTYPDTAPGAPPDRKPSWVREELEIRTFAESRGAALVSAVMGQQDQAEAAFARLAKDQVEAVLIAHHPLFQNHRKRVLELARKLKIPAVGHRTYFVEDGALLSYSTRLDEQMRRSARYVHRILNGTAPGELPIEEFDEVELAVNRGVAKAFGLPIPTSLLGRERNTRVI
jgi:putative ABC transport system substrate-binding protein